jgi:hypothetical protein
LAPARFPKSDFPYLSPRFELRFALLEEEEGNKEVEVSVVLKFHSNPSDRVMHMGGDGTADVSNQDVIDWLAYNTQ